MTTLKNYTPPTIVFRFQDGGEVSFHSEGVARVTETQEEVGTIKEVIPLRRTSYGEIVGLPEVEENVLLIVSLVVRQANDLSPNPRKDLISPDTGKSCIRGDNGQIIAVTGFCV